ncbi:MAG: hypothetical protein HWE27_04420 [Gammaproteobacteria bacterium]|nr:hypothetical protein [Gammaproteobacteria bacterium]
MFKKIIILAFLLLSKCTYASLYCNKAEKSERLLDEIYIVCDTISLISKAEAIDLVDYILEIHAVNDVSIKDNIIIYFVNDEKFIGIADQTVPEDKLLGTYYTGDKTLTLWPNDKYRKETLSLVRPTVKYAAAMEHGFSLTLTLKDEVAILSYIFDEYEENDSEDLRKKYVYEGSVKYLSDTITIFLNSDDFITYNIVPCLSYESFQFEGCSFGLSPVKSSVNEERGFIVTELWLDNDLDNVWIVRDKPDGKVYISKKYFDYSEDNVLKLKVKLELDEKGNVLTIKESFPLMEGTSFKNISEILNDLKFYPLRPKHKESAPYPWEGEVPIKVNAYPNVEVNIEFDDIEIEM